MKASNWAPRETQTLRGFFSLSLETGGIVIHNCRLHEQASGAKWVALPNKPVLGQDGRQAIGPDGKRQYEQILEIVGSVERREFQEQAMAALDELIGNDGMAEPAEERRQPARRAPARSLYRPPDRLTAGPALPDDQVDDLWRGGAP
jgi:hypothetical protein